MNTVNPVATLSMAISDFIRLDERGTSTATVSRRAMARVDSEVDRLSHMPALDPIAALVSICALSSVVDTMWSRVGCDETTEAEHDRALRLIASLTLYLERVAAIDRNDYVQDYFGTAELDRSHFPQMELEGLA